MVSGNELVDSCQMQDEIFSSSFAPAMNWKGILEELEVAGYTILGGPEDRKRTLELKANKLFEHDRSVGAVVIGLDQYINYYKLQYGNPACLLIATNREAVGHMTDLQEWPGAGYMVAAICGTTQKEPIVVGKPSTFMMQWQKLDTDILFGQNAGCRTLLVLSGCTDQSTLQDPLNDVQPEYDTNQVSDVYKYLSP